MKKILTLKNFLFVFISFAFFVCIRQAYINIDPDFGWHIKLGEMTLNNGAITKDPFSYTMPSFPFIDHEWLTNIFLYLLYENFGMLIAAVFYSVLAICAIWIALLRNKIKSERKIKPYLLTFLFILSIGLIPSFFGIRPQVQSWLMYSIFLSFLLNKNLFNKYFYLVPFFQIFWVNSHGSFPLPIVTLIIISIFRSIRIKRIWYLGFLTIFLSIIASGINPYGFRIWHEVYQQISDTSVRWVLVEWKPAFNSFNIFYLLFVSIYVVTLKRYFSLFDLEVVVLNIFFFVQGVTSVRHVPLWLIINLPMIYAVLVSYYSQFKNIKFAEQRYLNFTKGAIIVALFFYIFTVSPYIFSKNKGLTEDSFYPKNAISYLMINPSGGNLFSDYGWGGYLIWKYPEKKVFVDGRMATWKWEANIQNESNYVMEEYVSFIEGNLDMDGNFEKYNIDTVLWPNKPVINATFVLEEYVRNNIFKRKSKKVFDPNAYMLQKGWNLVYKDSVSSIYRKN